MCGIAGIVDARGTSMETGKVMEQALFHRGPDDGGVWQSSSGMATFANRRLAVIDLTQAGHMPMSSVDGRYCITYNGEIYNFRQLRSELEQLGHRFRSNTDTEVVLELFIQYGEAAVDRLNGMFAFAIWDERDHSLFLARDRFGIKPLYYTSAPGSLAFASEVQALLKGGVAKPSADPEAVQSFLTLGSVADDRTIIRGVSSLPPGHFARFHRDTLTIRRYWQYIDLLRGREVPQAEAASILRQALKDTVQRQMVSDAPLGVFLSSGLDSSSLVAFMRAAGGRSAIRAVSVSFGESDWDEAAEAKSVATRFGAEFVEVPVSFQEVRDGLDDVVLAMDQPSVDGVNTYFVSRAARQAGLTVALSGLGADEIFGGYPSFKLVPQARRALTVVHPLAAMNGRLSRLASSRHVPYSVRKLYAWSSVEPSLYGSYAAVRGLYSPREAQRLAPYGQAFDPVAYARSVAPIEGLDEQAAVSALEARLYMTNQLLRDSDAMSMAHSLEVRVPFLDDEVTAIAAAARESLQDKPKALLAEARRIYFPAGLTQGPKRGFTFPFQDWLRGPLREWAQQGLDTGAVIDRRYGSRVLREFEAGLRPWAHVWAPLVLERWLQQHGVTASA